MSKLYFRYGAMGCGKTAQLLQVAFNYNERGQKVAIMKPSTDTKAGKHIKTRIGLERPTDHLISPKENIFDTTKKSFSDASCILIDEAQFLSATQADQLMEVAVKLNIPVMAWGLRVNFRQDSSGFEGSTRLLQIAHDIEEIKTICDCGKKATMNSRFLNDRLVTDGPDILIDDGSTKIEYRALCPACWYRHLEKSKN